MSQELVKYLICQTNREPVASGMVSIHAVCERKETSGVGAREVAAM